MEKKLNYRDLRINLVGTGKYLGNRMKQLYDNFRYANLNEFFHFEGPGLEHFVNKAREETKL